MKKAAERLEYARIELARAILEARRSGETLRDIAPYAGLTHSRVHELAQEAEQLEQT